MARREFQGKKDIYDAFDEIGFSNVDFGPNFESVYEEYHWVILPHPVAIKRLYAIPPKEELLTKPWDSWYFIDGEAIHHIHTAWQVSERWSEWIQKDPAEECPDELVGITWFWINEDDITPSLLKEELPE